MAETNTTQLSNYPSIKNNFFKEKAKEKKSQGRDKMVEQKEVNSPLLMKIPKSQLTAGHLWTKE